MTDYIDRIVRLSKPCEEHPTGLYWSAMRDDGIRGTVTDRDDASRYGQSQAEVVLEEAVECGIVGHEPGVEIAGDEE